MFKYPAVFNLLLATMVGMASAPAVYSIAPSLEGTIFPVVDNVNIYESHAISDTTTEFSGSAKKIRECQFLRLEWFIVQNGHYAQVDLTFIEKSKARASGYFDFGPWNVKIPVSDFPQHSVAVVYHRCHWLWDTETKFYTPPAQTK